jgi:hypothetical protein
LLLIALERCTLGARYLDLQQKYEVHHSNICQGVNHFAGWMQNNWGYLLRDHMKFWGDYLEDYPDPLFVDSGPSYQKFYKAACEYIGVAAVPVVGRVSFKDSNARKAAEVVAKFWIPYKKRSTLNVKSYPIVKFYLKHLH